jgi:hypothetical protein
LILKTTQKYFAHLADDGTERIWYTERLWILAKDLPVKSVPIDRLAALDEVTWFGEVKPTCRRVTEHAKRIQSANFEHPIILSAEGWVMDGMHRVCKALLLEFDEIQAVQFSQNPEADECNPEKAGQIPTTQGGAGANAAGGD